ncbi:MAG: hypothetical protein DRP85_02135 [Candidatus Makaraimicrobium thalassicum]|nr:MAG: hypothetical protein DRP85_02135 [Candidatus Omnitrophota bacterium]
MPATFQDVNWLDIFFIILLLGMVYKGLKTGVSGQILSMMGLFVLIFVSIGYYGLLSEAIFGFLLQGWAKPLSFFFIGITIFIVIRVLERVFKIVGEEELATIERVGGVLVASFRAFILFGVIGIQLLLTPLDSMHLSAAEGSKVCMFFVNMDAQIYSWMTGTIGVFRKEQKDEVLERILVSTKKR